MKINSGDSLSGAGGLNAGMPAVGLATTAPQSAPAWCIAPPLGMGAILVAPAFRRHWAALAGPKESGAYHALPADKLRIV